MTKRKAPIVGKFTFNHSEWWFINCLWWFIGILGLGTGHFSGRYNPLFNAWSQAWNLALFVHGGPLPENWEFSEPIRMLLALFSRQSFLCFWSQPQRVKSMDLGFEKKLLTNGQVKPWWSHGEAMNGGNPIAECFISWKIRHQHGWELGVSPWLWKWICVLAKSLAGQKHSFVSNKTCLDMFSWWSFHVCWFV